MLTIFGWNFEIWAVQKYVNLVDLNKSFPTSIELQKSASIFFFSFWWDFSGNQHVTWVYRSNCTGLSRVPAAAISDRLDFILKRKDTLFRKSAFYRSRRALFKHRQTYSNEIGSDTAVKKTLLVPLGLLRRLHSLLSSMPYKAENFE